MLDVNTLVGTHDILFITLDTLRFDVAEQCFSQGRLPTLARYLPSDGWQRRHTPGSFTFAAHQAFFAGFLPTPPTPGPHPRLFAARFEGSETTTSATFVYDSPTWIQALRAQGYYTVCIGGVGFFNKQTALGSVLPGYFETSHWSPELGVASRNSTAAQVSLAVRLLAELSPQQRILMFLNVSAIHQPNCIFTTGATTDSPETQANALAYVDGELARLFSAYADRGSAFCIICSDHGTAYGEAGYSGHRIAHPVVWEVPYAEFFISDSESMQ
jgi:hypothetical protein